MHRWWVNLVRKIMSLPPLADGPLPLSADQIVYFSGHQAENGVYSDPVSDAVVMGIIFHGALNHDVQSVSDAG